MTDICPHCDANLQGSSIVAQDRKYYGDKTHYSRKIGIYIRGIYDGVLFWQCPDCGGRWNRWPAGDRLHDLAVKFLEADDRLHDLAVKFLKADSAFPYPDDTDEHDLVDAIAAPIFGMAS